MEAERILGEGRKEWHGGHLLLDRWHPSAGCRWNEKGQKEGRVWVYGLPVHLWGCKTFEKIGTPCGGLVDVETDDPCSMEWVSY